MLLKPSNTVLLHLGTEEDESSTKQSETIWNYKLIRSRKSELDEWIVEPDTILLILETEEDIDSQHKNKKTEKIEIIIWFMPRKVIIFAWIL